MSDVPHGDGWWIASDGKYYPPEQHPDYRPAPPTTAMPPTAPTPTAAPPTAPVPPAAAAPAAWPTQPVAQHSAPWSPPPGQHPYPGQPQPAWGAPQPSYQPAQKSGSGCLKGGLVVGAILVGIVILVGVIGAIAGSGDPDDVAAGGTDPAANAPAETAPTKGGSREAPLPFGQPHDIGDGWTVKVAEYIPDANAAIAAANMFNEPAPPGQTYVIVRPEATYSGADTRTTWDISFSVVGASRVPNDAATSMCVPPEPAWNMIGEVFPGGTMSGNICIAVPSGDVDSLVLIAEPTLALSGNRAFLALR